MGQIDNVKRAMMNENGFMFLEAKGTKMLLEECGSEEAAGRLLVELVTLTNNPAMLIEAKGVKEETVIATFLCPKGWLPSHWERFFEHVVDLAIGVIGLTILAYVVWYNDIGEGIQRFQVQLGGPGVYRQRAQL